MLTLNDLQRLEIYAQRPGINHPGIMYRMGMRLMRQGHIDLAKKAFECMCNDFSDFRLNAEANFQLGEINQSNTNDDFAAFHFHAAAAAYRSILNYPGLTNE